MEHSLFIEASRDLEAEERQLRMAKVRTGVQEIFSFLALAASPEEYEHRKALARDSLVSVAARHGVGVEEVEGVTDRMFSMLTESRVVQAAMMTCGNCGHRSGEHAQGATCPTCRCDNFTPQTTAAKEGRRVTAEEGSGPFM